MGASTVTSLGSRAIGSDMTSAALLTVAVVLAAPHAADSPGARSHWDDLVQPAAYASSGGEFLLRVRSIARDWRAGGHLRVERRGQLVWEADVPCVPWDAAVLDDGRVVGCGFDGDEERWSHLVFTAFALNGDLLWQHSEPGQAQVVGLVSEATRLVPPWFVQAEAGKVVFQLDRLGGLGARAVRFRVLDLDHGTDIGVWTWPHPPAMGARSMWLEGIELLPTSRRLLTLWTGYPMPYGVALHAAPEWPTVRAPELLAWWQAEPAAGGEDTRRRWLYDRPRLECTDLAAESFAIAFGEARHVQRLRIERAAERWVIEAHALEAMPSEQPPLVELEELAPLALKLPPVQEEPEEDAVTSLAWIETFGFDERGDLEVVSSVDSTLAVRTLDRNGAVLRTATLGPFDFELDYQCECADGPAGTWLVAVPTDSGGTVHRIDGTTGKAEKLCEVEVMPDVLRAFPGGGFVLAEPRIGLRCFDAQGQPVQPATERDAAELVPDVEWVIGRGLSAELIVLEQSYDGAHRVRILVDGGRVVRSVDPAQWDRTALDHLYLAESIHQTRAGSFWITSTTAEHPFMMEVAFTGEVIRVLEPHLEDGACFPFARGAIDVDPSGTFWSANHDAVAAYSPDRGPGPVLGRRFDPQRWQDASSWTMDRSGRIVMAAGRRCAQVFDRAGEPLALLDVPTTLEEPSGLELSVDGAGVTWWRVGFRDQPLARFGAHGEFLGARHLPHEGDPVRFFGEGTSHWTYDREAEEPVRFDASGEVRRRVAQRPDGAWWRDVRELVVSPDGRRLVVSDQLRAGGRDEGALLACFDLEAGTQWYLDQPGVGGRLSLASDWVCWGRTLVHWPSREVRSIGFDGARVVDTPQGTEVWLLAPTDEAESPRFRRFAVPAAD